MFEFASVKNIARISVIVLAIAAVTAFAQNKPVTKMPASGPAIIDQKVYKEAIDKRWAEKIARCGDSYYMWGTDVSSNWENRTLVEIRGLTFDNTGDYLSADGSGKTGWSGVSVAKFAQSRTMAGPRGKWSDWIAAGSETTKLDVRGMSWVFSPSYSSQPIICSDAQLFTGDPDPGVELPETLKKGKFTAMDGSVFTLPDLKGKVVLINLWATWCGPCKIEMPVLDALYKKYQTADFQVIGFDVETSDTPKMIEAVRKQWGVTYTLVKGEASVDGEFVKISRMNGIPQSFLLTKQGKLVAVLKGFNPRTTAVDLERKLKLLLDEKP